MTPENLKRDGYLSVPVQFTVTSGIRQLKEILYGIEISKEYLTIEKVKVIARMRKDMTNMESTITVAGFMKKNGEL